MIYLLNKTLKQSFFFISFIRSIILGILTPSTPNADPPNFTIVRGSNRKLIALPVNNYSRKEYIILADFVTPLSIVFCVV